MTTREKIFKEVDDERLYQDAKWGGPEHDDKEREHDWTSDIERYVHGNGEHGFRTSMVKVAALAVAAIESHDRKNAVVTRTESE